MPFRILAYKQTTNLGDAIQSFAMSRLLPGPLTGAYRDELHQVPKDQQVNVVNGFLWDLPGVHENFFFCGIHLAGRIPEHIEWIKQSRFQIGARDPHTQTTFRENGVTSSLVGCATLTLPKAYGPRTGVMYVDTYTDKDTHTQNIPKDMPWEEQWSLAKTRLGQLMSAELVVTSRLHVVLPCLAFGTPVMVPEHWRKDAFMPSRLSLLDHLGFEYGKAMTLDVGQHAYQYRQFLAGNLGIVDDSAGAQFPTVPASV